MRKYEFTGRKEKILNLETRVTIEVKEIRALKNFRKRFPYENAKGEMTEYLIEAGTLGGWIESEENLSQEGDCWVRTGTIVSGNAMVCDNALVFNHARIMDEAIVKGESMVASGAAISGNAIIDTEYIPKWASISTDAKITNRNDLLCTNTIDNTWSTFYKTCNNEIMTCTCTSTRSQTLASYLEEVIKKYGVDSHEATVRRAVIELAKVQILGVAR